MKKLYFALQFIIVDGIMLKYCVVSIWLNLHKISNDSLVFPYLTSSPNNCSMQACKTMITIMLILVLEKNIRPGKALI